MQLTPAHPRRRCAQLYITGVIEPVEAPAAAAPTPQPVSAPQRPPASATPAASVSAAATTGSVPAPRALSVGPARLADAAALLQPQTASEVLFAACHAVLVDAGFLPLAAEVPDWRRAAPALYRLAYTLPALPPATTLVVKAVPVGPTLLVAAAQAGREAEGVVQTRLATAQHVRLDMPCTGTRTSTRPGGGGGGG